MKKHSLTILAILLLLLQTPAWTMSASFRDRIRIEVCKRKEQVVRITPNPSKDGALTVISQCDQPVYFYVFDVEGTLVKQVLLPPGAKTKIHIRQKGVYAYDVFRNDEGVEQGKITVL